MMVERSEPEPSPRVRVRRHPERGSYDSDLIDAILDEGSICHVAYQFDSGPVVVPTLYGRLGDFVYFHGSPAAGMFRHSTPGVDICLAVTLVDGYVLARSLFHHSMNYRSVVVFGRAEHVTDGEDVMRGLEAITENVLPGRWNEARLPNETELRQTAVYRIGLDEASAKVRTGPPGDDAEDMALTVWAGVIPSITTVGQPVPSPDLAPGMPPTRSLEGVLGKLGQTLNG